jgi:hypothetical protein
MQLTPEQIAPSLSYTEYRTLVETLHAQGKSSRSVDSLNTPDMLEYVKMNLHRIHRLDKTCTLLPEVQAHLDAMAKPERWICLTEGWCGDASQIVPVLNKIAEGSHGKIDLHILLRDEHLDLMDQFLTNGGRAIPKVIKLDPETLEVIGDWGPRPIAAQEMVLEFKRKSQENPDGLKYKDMVAAIHKWYADDHTASTQREALGIPVP